MQQLLVSNQIVLFTGKSFDTALFFYQQFVINIARRTAHGVAFWFVYIIECVCNLQK